LGLQDPEVAVNLIRAYLDDGQKERALQLAESAGRGFANAPEFHLALGKCFLSHNLLPPARASLERANRLMPSQPEIVLPLADALVRQNDPAAARKVLGNIAGKAQDMAAYHYLLAQSHFLSGQKEPALQEMNQAIRLDAKNPVYPLTLGRYYQKYEDQKKALSALEDAARLDAHLAEVPYSIAVSYSMNGDFDAARKYLDQALQMNPSFDRAMFLLATLRLSEGKFDESEKLLGQAVKLQPQNPYYQCFYGMLLVSENRLPEALERFQKTLALDASYALAHYQLGRLLARTGKPEEARQELEKALSLQPDLSEAYYVLSRTYYKLGDKEKGDKALAIFRSFRAAEYTERQEILRQMQKAVQGPQ
jgi:superkiller protein 3